MVNEYDVYKIGYFVYLTPIQDNQNTIALKPMIFTFLLLFSIPS